MAQKFETLTVIVGNNGGMTLKSGNKSIELYRKDGKLKVGGVTVGNMPQDIAAVKAMAVFWTDVHSYLDGML
jgi:glutamate mutase epsilon subunit